MFKNKKIVLFLLVLPLVAVLVAPKVALADDDSDWVKNIPIIGGVVDFASDPGGWITDRFAEGAEFFFNDGLQNIKTTSTKSILGKSFNNLLGKKTGTFYSTVSFVNKSVVMPTAAYGCVLTASVCATWIRRNKKLWSIFLQELLSDMSCRRNYSFCNGTFPKSAFRL